MRFHVVGGKPKLTSEVFDATSAAMALVRRDREEADGTPHPVVVRARETETLDMSDAADVIMKLGSVAAGENPAESYFSQRAARTLESIARNPVAREFFDVELLTAWDTAFPDEPFPDAVEPMAA